MKINNDTVRDITIEADPNSARAKDIKNELDWEAKVEAKGTDSRELDLEESVPTANDLKTIIENISPNLAGQLEEADYAVIFNSLKSDSGQPPTVGDIAQFLADLDTSNDGGFDLTEINAIKGDDGRVKAPLVDAVTGEE